ncbi:MAG: hypothetical protein KC613_03410, partial [Myxococcales bacterium]|nr:hypothetical protein [Myxococcales bacterium]
GGGGGGGDQGVAQCLDGARRCASDGTLEACAQALNSPSSDTCVHRQRALTALAEALAPARAGAIDAQAAALAQRLLQQWLTVHGVLARDVDRAAQIDLLLNDGRPGGTDLSLRQALLASLTGWDLLLHPRVAHGLTQLDAAALAAPDYRAALFPGGVAGLDPDAPTLTQPQAVGLPVALLDLWTTQLGAFVRLVREAQAGLNRFDAVEDLYGQLGRRGALVLALAWGLRARAGDVPWADQWDLAQQAVGAATAQAQAAIADLRAGRNALGIEDIDLPIYRVGDQAADGARFSALSDSLIGRPGDARPIVPSLIERARARLAEARDAFVGARDRDLDVEQLRLARERRLMEINRLYGEQIIGLCLNPDWVAFDILEQWDTIDPDTCFLDTELEPSCVPTAENAAAAVDSAGVAYDICLVAGLRDALGGGVATGSATADDVVTRVGPALGADRAHSAFTRLQVTAVAPGEGPDEVLVTFTHDGAQYTVNRPDLAALNLELPPDLPPETLPDIWRLCGHRREVALARRPERDPATCERADQCTAGAACFRGACRHDLAVDPARRPECYRGVMGEVALAVEAANTEIEVARAELDEFSQAFDIAVQGCLIQQDGFERAEELTRQHNIVMGALGGAKLAAQLTLFGLEAAGDALSITDGSSINLGALAATATVAPKAAIASLELAMEIADREYEAAREIIENATAIKLCFNDAQTHLIGARAAALRIQQATLQATRQIVEFNNLKVTLSGLLLEGHLSLEAERARVLHPLDTDYWIDEAFDAWFRVLRQARRATYLALLAVEYEFQLSLDSRDDVLRAEHPNQLEAVLDSLRGRVATGTVNGAAPTTLVEVVSLREHLLRLADRSALPPGWRRLDPAARFGRWLADPAFAVYDPVDGTWLGQEVPFSVMPQAGSAAEGLGISLLTGTDCAERLWSLNASVVGPAVEGDASTFTRVVVRHRNTFHSQHCTQRGTLQTAATRPSRNLFLDPVAYDPVEQPPGGVGEDTGFTSARVQARIGVTRAELEDEAFAQGASEELAGRGLYGDYRLFIPATSLGDGGLDLLRVEDILLRLDYVSVARAR